jgi:hypothetical protein
MMRRREGIKRRNIRLRRKTAIKVDPLIFHSEEAEQEKEEEEVVG